jgi:transglutaminase-like putative cysteine protease
VRRLTRGLPSLVDPVLCLAAVGASTALYGGYFDGSRYLWPLLVAALAGAVVGSAVAAARSVALVFSVTVAGFALLAAELLYRGSTEYGFPTLRALRTIGVDLDHGWGRLLSVGVPADPRPELLVLPLAVTWTSAVAAVTLARWTQATLAPVVPPLVALVLPLLVAAPTHPHVAATAGFISAATLLALGRATRTRTVQPVTAPGIRIEEAPRSDGSSPAGAPRSGAISGLGAGMGRSLLAVTVAAVVVAAAAATAFLPRPGASQRFDPRRMDPPPVTVNQTITPLATIRGQLHRSPAQVLFTVRASDRLDRIRIAALNHYDGATWTSAPRYLVAGRTLSAPFAAPRGRQVAISIRVEDLPGPFLPVVGQPVRLDLADGEDVDLGFDADTATLVTDPLAMRGLAYRLTASAVPVRLTDADRPALPPDGIGETTLPPGIPNAFSELARRLSAAGATPLQRLQATQAVLRSRPYSIEAAPGHSYGSLARMLFTNRRPDDLGYAEQHAAAFAVLARAQGFACRVAVGYRLQRPKNGVFTVTTAEADAWPEVYFDGLGWVPFDATDPRRTPSGNTVRPQPPVPAAESPAPPSLPAPQATPSRHGPPGSGVDLVRVTIVAWLSVLTLLVVSLLLTLAAKAVRRHRRRRRTGSAGVEGAWAESMDRMTEHGRRPPPWATHTEIVECVTDREAAHDALSALAVRAAAARYAGREPPAGEDQEAWRLERALDRALSAGRRRVITTARARIDPRPLWTPAATRAASRSPEGSTR